MKNKQNTYYINRNIRFFMNLYMYLYIFQVHFNNIVPEAGYTYIFIPVSNSTITFTQQFHWIITTECDLLGQLNLKNLNLAFEKNVNNKRKSVSGMKYIHFSCFTYS